MATPLYRNILLEATDREFESQAVLNPGCHKEGDTVHMLYRAVRPANRSSIGYCRIKDRAVEYRHPEPILQPEYPYESQGTEDPRVTVVDGVYHVMYVAYSGKNARLCHASGTDILNLTKHGPVSPPVTFQEITELCRSLKGRHEYYSYCHSNWQRWGSNVFLWEKDGILFPEKIRGKWALIHRILPDIQIAYFESFEDLSKGEYWDHYLRNLEHGTLMRPRYWYEDYYIGGGAPPIRTEDGWLMVYHAVHHGKNGPVYTASLALLDKDNPRNVLARLPDPLFEPEKQWERVGDVGNVVFPTGAIANDDGTLDIYYGAADSRIGLITYRLSELLEELQKNRLKPLYEHSTGRSA